MALLEWWLSYTERLPSRLEYQNLSRVKNKFKQILSKSKAMNLSLSHWILNLKVWLNQTNYMPASSWVHEKQRWGHCITDQGALMTAQKTEILWRRLAWKYECLPAPDEDMLVAFCEKHSRFWPMSHSLSHSLQKTWVSRYTIFKDAHYKWFLTTIESESSCCQREQNIGKKQEKAYHLTSTACSSSSFTVVCQLNLTMSGNPKIGSIFALSQATVTGSTQQKGDWQRMWKGSPPLWTVHEILIWNLMRMPPWCVFPSTWSKGCPVQDIADLPTTAGPTEDSPASVCH